MPGHRLDRLPVTPLAGGLHVLEARGFTARLLGLAWLDELSSNAALLIPRCQSVHTFGMRFPIDVVFLDRAGAPLHTRERLSPRRISAHRHASAALETPAGRAGRFIEAAGGRFRLPPAA